MKGSFGTEWDEIVLETSSKVDLTEESSRRRSWERRSGKGRWRRGGEESLKRRGGICVEGSADMNWSAYRKSGSLSRVVLLVEVDQNSAVSRG
jgi:hypothetical protein